MHHASCTKERERFIFIYLDACFFAGRDVQNMRNVPTIQLCGIFGIRFPTYIKSRSSVSNQYITLIDETHSIILNFKEREMILRDEKRSIGNWHLTHYTWCLSCLKKLLDCFYPQQYSDRDKCCHIFDSLVMNTTKSFASTYGNQIESQPSATHSWSVAKRLCGSSSSFEISRQSGRLARSTVSASRPSVIRGSLLAKSTAAEVRLHSCLPSSSDWSSHLERVAKVFCEYKGDFVTVLDVFNSS